MKNSIFPILISLLFVTTSCEDVIDLNLDEGESQLVVDAFVTSEKKVQTIKLTKSAAYFNNALPTGVSGASVSISGSDGSSYIFNEASSGNYIYDATSSAIDSIGTIYTLNIRYEGKDYISKSKLHPVPSIDSIAFFEEEDPFNGEKNTFAEFFATDIPGRTDYYWIKSFKNNLSTDDLGTFNIIKDGSFIGNAADGFLFILPIRRSINIFDEPFEINDTSRVELYSMNKGAWDFLERVNTESNNGGLFAVPPSNIKSNILDAAGNSQEEVLGVFTVMSVVKRKKVYTGF